VAETVGVPEQLSVLGLIRSDDPLSAVSFEFLLNYHEEDPLVDFKESFDPKEEREWLEITKEVIGFANASGGFLVFGIKDETFEKVGLSSSVVDTQPAGKAR
jgi:predicted HTH transcriptional regulator